jgi:hypothetical protein
VKSNYPEFYEELNQWSIWNISSPSTAIDFDLIPEWNEYSETLETIYAFQLYQKLPSFDTERKNWLENNDLNDILTIDMNSWNVIIIHWKRGNQTKWHALVPYKVEWNKIYVRDSLRPYPWTAYENYIEIFDDNSWQYNTFVNSRSSFDIIYVVNINNLWAKQTRIWLPIWFNWNDNSYILEGDQDIYVTDFEGRKTWFIGWNDIVDHFRQIYVNSDNNVDIIISWKNNKSYNLMIAWWDYFAKLEWIKTGTWEIDKFTSTNGILNIDFDDNKSDKTYDVFIDNFVESSTWTVYFNQTEKIIGEQSLNIDWEKVWENAVDSVEYSADIDGDWTVDETSTFYPTSKDTTSPISSHSFSWTLVWTGNVFEPEVIIELSADDSDWVGIDKIFYSLWDEELEYDENVVIGEEWEYILEYYAVDLNGNTEEKQQVAFSVIEPDREAPTSSHSFSWTLSGTGNIYEPGLIIDIVSDDWDWDWVDKIFYSLWDEELEYSESIMINDAWEYVLQYYAIDVNWNTEELKTVNFSIIYPETNTWKISWYVYKDSNNNGEFDEGEKTKQRWKIYLDLNNDWKLQKDSEPFYKTTKDGYYEFTDLSMWDYIVRAKKRNKKIFAPVEWYHELTLESWEMIENLNFSKKVIQKWSVYGYIYNDKNSNWVFDKREATQHRWRVYLDLNNDGQLQKDEEPFYNTTRNWYYEFRNFPVWDYTIRAEQKKSRKFQQINIISTINISKWWTYRNITGQQ